MIAVERGYAVLELLVLVHRADVVDVQLDVGESDVGRRRRRRRPLPPRLGGGNGAVVIVDLPSRCHFAFCF